MSETKTAFESLLLLLRALKLPGFARYHEEIAQTAEREGWTFGRFLHHLAQVELDERKQRRIERYLKDSDLPLEKTLATLDRKRLPAKVQKQVPTLCEGAFIERGDNVLVFGLPGRGKTHVVCAIGHELVRRGHRVLFVPTYGLVQRLLIAKRDLRLERELHTLDTFDAVILDDIGYVQQSREEMEVLFTFLAERYERRSVIITSNLVFSQWDRIFKDPMTTAAAIDRLVHHAIIVEMTGESVRADEAKKRGTAPVTMPADVAAGGVPLPAGRSAPDAPASGNVAAGP
jgi:DNA replication protein DnaC